MLALKKAFTVVALTVTLLTVSPVAHAQAQGFWGSIASWWDDVVEWVQDKITEYEAPPVHDGRAVPELDPSAAGSAAVLLLGGVAFIAARRREEDLTE